MQIFHRLPTPSFKGADSHDVRPHVLTIGNFDGVHLGHKALFERVNDIARVGGACPSAMTFSPHARVFFHGDTNFLLTDNNERSQLIAETGVECLFQLPFDIQLTQMPAQQFAEELMTALPIKHIVVGDDFRFGHKGLGDVELLHTIGKRHGVCVEDAPTVRWRNQRISSSLVRDKIVQGQFADVEQLLGRKLTYSAHVIDGNKLGRTIDVPTANMRIDDTHLLPSGVFAVEVTIAGDAHIYRGMTNIGTKPTVDDRLVRQIETNIFEFSADIYGREMTIRPLKKLRDEQKFSGVNELIEQLQCDKQAALQVFASMNMTL